MSEVIRTSSVIADANNDQGFDSTVTAAVIGIVIPVGKLLWFNLQRSQQNIRVNTLLWFPGVGKSAGAAAGEKQSGSEKTV